MKADLTRYHHWIFDLDGTLTQAVHDFKRMRGLLNIPLDEDILTHIERLPHPLRVAKKQHLDELERFYAEQAQPAEGVYDLLVGLAERGVALGIVTRNSKELAHLSLNVLGIEKYFCSDHIIGRDEAIPKPHPDGLQRLMQSWGVEPHQTLMVGDYKYDLLAGRAAGCSTLHITKSEERWPDMTDFHCETLAALALLIK